MYYQSPLVDITNAQVNGNANVLTKPSVVAKKTAVATADVKTTIKKVIRHDPYGWKCLPDDLPSAAPLFNELDVPVVMPPPQELFQEKGDQAPAAPAGPPVCRALVQFKCRQSEFSSPLEVGKGQYVVVQGDRGIDIGVVIRVNTDTVRTYVECSGPVGSILRHATQAEVNYWATDLKEAEAVAVECCQGLVRRHGFEMSIVHAEYQFDKKKLTFYYESRVRIDFVHMLKELYREFGCRIWMEKVRLHE